ncbi:hypothetical protein RAA17_20405 [Komagataeibacter rhaeticus]|nr:hypothetical protein [Komagataeibacter rhaeticus]
MLVVLDGFGWREDPADNAVRAARTPAFDALWQAGPRAFLKTCGEDVGLPQGADGQFRGRSPQYRRGPGGDAGTAPHFHGACRWFGGKGRGHAGFHRRTEKAAAPAT